MQIGNEDDSLRRRLVQLTHLYFRETFQELQKIGIHPKQVPFMILLSDHEGLSQREISEELGISPPTVAVSVKRLEKSGLVERQEDAKDQRRCRTYLTTQGKAVICNVKKCVEEKEALVFQGFTEGEQCLMKRFFDQMIENLTEKKEETGKEKTDV